MSSRERSRNPQIYISKLSSVIREKDLEDKFSKYGDIRRVQLKNGYAFIEYFDYKDAEYAIERMDGRSWEGHRIVVQPSIGKRKERSRDSPDRDDRGRGDSRDRGRRDDDRRRGPQKDDKCFVCGERGHWANQCQVSRRSRYVFIYNFHRDRNFREEIKCFSCGGKGHKQRYCKNRRSNSERRRYDSRDRSVEKVRDRSREREVSKDASRERSRRRSNSSPRSSPHSRPRNQSEDIDSKPLGN